MAEFLSIDALRPGMVIVQITAQNGPVRIRKSGLVTSGAMIEGLREMGVQEVEIDPAQTVEVADGADSQVAHSPTKTLLMQDSSRNQVDSRLSDQFHRSLFLPSVQSLPDNWHYYSRKAGMAALVFIGGLALGWNIANYPMWMTLFASDAQAELTAKPVSTLSQPVPDKVSTDTSALPEISEEVARTDATRSVDEAGITARGNTQTNVTGQRNDSQTQEEGQRVRAEKESPAAGDISPELLDKFRQAVSALESTDTSVSEPTVEPPQEVVPVDQLPSWVLAELPSLSFSAHMFASNPKDRWVRVNGQELKEGGWLDQELRIVAIQSQHVILAYKGQEFSMRALTDW
ncbi:general secretion pathway protein GspB [Lacimicrobium alkaliphilum]|uniref:DUF3391 domain-containing protein n=1 Tax=Lacimicrobium alkaliphilum TaxID=1526571 RepID=A0ABQ1R4L7_9ALTE|nr:general secretion pathway protein GspB [Lacimicrobium alkaliphilum]GGD58047.1 hypothetical protein GCM10011357_11750 [Lacimicrobium alkaliphilum]